MDKRTFWTVKSPEPEYHLITFSHPAFDAPIRLVANQFAPVTIDGQVYTPAPMSVKPPDQTSGGHPKLTLVFPRQVVGRQFKQQLALIMGAATLEPIAVRYELRMPSVVGAAVSWDLYASDSSGVAFTPEAVQVSAQDTNPMRRQVAPVYDPGVFTGLEVI